MSFPEASRRIVLSPRAKQDFIDILRYTGETWGPEQLHAYRNKLNGALQRIARNPSIGNRAPELPETHRLYFIGSHVIIYRTQDASIAVVRILHQRMSLIKHL
ncbi:hypothetical protein GRF61_19550 [Azoarcus sp. TTM-91]|uniref:type II toxin-antitoxin system RelE/ParE family toxin n=1 Tax=Azoarcus sp. TTM-91 TaxID=2691581 RepID=UPI00145C9DAD|nr:type II toxin-antitoxin system RelE/ParE family toxin [Azoarcus sp. TTM-91]NMG36651.1 hypothetical protein [Azoarcus sp. TTM-91]